MGLGSTEILVVVLMLVLLFGAKRIPGLARGLGKSVISFRAGMRGETSDSDNVSEVDSSTGGKAGS